MTTRPLDVPKLNRVPVVVADVNDELVTESVSDDTLVALAMIAEAADGAIFRPFSEMTLEVICAKLKNEVA